MVKSKLKMGNNNKKISRNCFNYLQNKIVNNNSISIPPSKSLNFPDNIIKINKN